MYIQNESIRLKANAATLIGVVFAAYLNAVVIAVGSVIIVSLPDGAKYYNFSWNLFYLFSAIAMPIAGRFGDLLGKRLLYSIGLSLCLGGTVIITTVSNMLQFAVIRSVIGVGYGIILSISVAILGGDKHS